MEVTLDIRKVTSIELDPQHESENHMWRELVIRTADGVVRISLYSDDIDEDALKVKA